MEQPNTDHRINTKQLLASFFQVLNFERGILLTTRELLLRPGKTVQAYLHGDRVNYTSPLQFAIVVVGFWTLLFRIVSYFKGRDFFSSAREGVIDGYNNHPSDEEIENAQKAEKNEFLAKIFEGFDYFSEYQNIFNILLIPALALLSYWIYKKYRLYYAEHIVIGAYMAGMIAAIGMLLLPISLFNFEIGLLIGGFFSLAYMFWAYMDIFKERFIKGFFKSSLLITLYFVAAFVLFFIIFVVYAIYQMIQLKGSID